MTFAQSFMKKSPFLWRIFKGLIKFYFLTKFCYVGMFDSIIAIPRVFFVMYTEIYFLCLILFLRRFTATKILKLVILFLVLFFNTYIFQFLQLRCQWRLFKSLFEKCIQEDSVYKEPFVLNEKWKPKWN